METALKTLKKLIPARLFAALQPLYHYALAGVAGLIYGFPSRRLSIVGVTGTNGKTTTATLLYRIAMALGYKAGLISTIENRIAGTVIPTHHTTPDPISLNRTLRAMVEAGCTHVFMEVSSHAMHQNRVMGIRFAGGIFTNLTHDHLDYHKSFENYFKAKKKFFEMLPRDSFALSNTDVPFGDTMLEHITAVRYSYGFTGGEAFHGEIEHITTHGLELVFNGVKVTAKLLGTFNAYNLLAVWSACELLGFDREKVTAILKDIDPPTGRFEHLLSPQGVMIIVDYAHTPDALENVLNTLRTSFSGARVISLFGCGGDRDPMKRKLMGSIGTRLSDQAIFTSDNPRSEDPEKILDQMESGLTADEKARITRIADRRAAIAHALQIAHTGDIILCAGKGHETYQEIAGVKYPFNDVEEFKKLFVSHPHS